MPKYVMTNAYLAINGTAISDHASSLTLEDSAEEIDFTSFSANGYREFGQGLKDATITTTLFADFAAASVHAIIQPLYQSGGTFTVEVRPVNATVTSTNPKATMVSRIYSYSGIAGGVGEAATFEASFRNAGTAGLTWATV